MTVLTGTIAASARGGVINANLTVALSQYGVDYWPPHETDASAGFAGDVVRNLPVSMHPRVLPGAVSTSYVGDYYDRIHVIPALINLGNLLKAQTRSITIWNAWRSQSLTLNSVQQSNASGVTLTGPGALPLTFTPLQWREWTVTVSTDGPAAIAAVLTWHFAGGAAPQVEITGKQLTIWFTPPNWAHGITETLSWLTDVQQAWHGDQDRTPMRKVPRREWEFAIMEGSTPRQALENLLFAWRARVFALPVWADQSFLSAFLPANSTTIVIDTTNLDFAAGNTALLRGFDGSHESVEIATVAAGSLTLARPTAQAWPAGTAIYPCREARLTDTPKLDRDNADVMHAQLRFADVSESDWPAVAPAVTYRGLPVLLTHPDESQDPTAQFDRVIDRFDNGLSLPVVTDRTDVAFPKQPYRWMLYGRADRASQRSLLYWLAGRVQALWLPTFADDLTVTAIIAAADTIIRVRYVGAALYLQNAPARRHIRIELNDGTCYMRQVTAASDLGDGTEQMALDSSLGALVDPADIRQVSWMMLATQATDQVQIQHLTDSEGVARCVTNFVGVPREEPA